MPQHDCAGLSRVAAGWQINRINMSQAGARIGKAFATAVIRGGIAAAMLPTALVMMMLIGSVLSNPVDRNDLIAAVGLLLLPFAVAVLVIAASSMLIGLPVTMILRRTGLETAFNYAFAGGACGFAIPLIWGAMTAAGRPDLSLALLGAVGGTVTARTWWKERSPVTIAQA